MSEETRWACADCWWTYPNAELYEAHKEHCTPDRYKTKTDVSNNVR